MPYRRSGQAKGCFIRQVMMKSHRGQTGDTDVSGGFSSSPRRKENPHPAGRGLFEEKSPSPLLHRLGGKEGRIEVGLNIHAETPRCRYFVASWDRALLEPHWCRRHRLGGTNEHPVQDRRPSERRLPFSPFLSEELKVITADVGEGVVALEILNRPELNVTQGHEA